MPLHRIHELFLSLVTGPAADRLTATSTQKEFNVETPLSHLAHLEITTPDVEASARFYEEKFGMRIIDRVDGNVYLRCWGDYYRYSLVVTEGPKPPWAGWPGAPTPRQPSKPQPQRVEATGVQGDWTDGGHGYGKAYEFTGPYGHRMRLFWDVEKFVAEPGFASTYPDRPERRSSHAAAPRFLDHVTVACSDVRGFAKWYNEALGFRVMAFVDLDEAPISVFSVLTTNEKSHDLGVVLDTSSRAGRVNHFAFWVDTTRGPAPHRRRPDGERHPDGVRPLHPRHRRAELPLLPRAVRPARRAQLRRLPQLRPGLGGQHLEAVPGLEQLLQNGAMPHSMTESFPPADGPTATEEGVPDEIKEALLNPYAKQGQG